MTHTLPTIPHSYADRPTSRRHHQHRHATMPADRAGSAETLAAPTSTARRHTTGSTCHQQTRDREAGPSIYWIAEHKYLNSPRATRPHLAQAVPAPAAARPEAYGRPAGGGGASSAPPGRHTSPVDRLAAQLHAVRADNDRAGNRHALVPRRAHTPPAAIRLAATHTQHAAPRPRAAAASKSPVHTPNRVDSRQAVHAQHTDTPLRSASAFPVHTPEQVDIQQHQRESAPRMRLGLTYPHGPLAERANEVAREREEQQQILDEHIPRWRIRFALALGLFPILWVLPRCGECKRRWPCPKLIDCLRNKHGWVGSIMPHVKQLATKRRRKQAQTRNATAVSHRAPRRSGKSRTGRRFGFFNTMEVSASCA